MALARSTTPRVVEVAPERLSGWLSGFADRHGPAIWQATAEHVIGTASDGAVAACAVPFPPMSADNGDPCAALVAHALLPRRVGVLLVRLGGYAAGVFEGTRLVSSKVGSRPVHGRNAAGGQSQQRFARRREGQVRVALGEAADVAARILLPAVGSLDAVVLGGDRRAVSTVLADRRLAPLTRLVVDRMLDVADPRLRVLSATPPMFRALRITVTDP